MRFPQFCFFECGGSGDGQGEAGRRWLDSCDESERQQMGQAAYHTFLVSSKFCLWMWVALVMLNMVFGFGLMPIAAVLLVLGVMQGSYTLESIRIAKKSQMRHAEGE